MTDNLAASGAALETWLVDSSGNIAVSGAGLALLESEITPLHSASTGEFSSPNE